jgi:phosphatidylglycerophosphate synthase
MSTSAPASTESTARAKLLRRLRPYYKMEAANVVMVPLIACVAVLADPAGVIRLAMIAAMVATSFLLVVGTIAWKMVVDGLEGNRATERTWVPRLDAARWPSLALILIALVLTGMEAAQTLPAWPGSLIAATILLVLAILEYINYYHYQLQHFDHAADFARLMSGRGFRRSHLSRAIAAWKAAKKERV